MEEPMFYGAKVKRGEDLEIEIPEDRVLHLTAAVLGPKVGKERHVLIAKVNDDTEFVICSLTVGVCEQATLNLRLNQNDQIELSVQGGNGEIHITGYSEPDDSGMENMMMGGYPGMGGMDDDDEDEFEEDDDTDEEVKRNTMMNAALSASGAQAFKAMLSGSKRKAEQSSGPAKKQKTDDTAEGAGSKAEDFGKLLVKNFADIEEGDEDDDESYVEEEEDDDESESEDDEEQSAKHAAFADSSDEDEGEDESDESEEDAGGKKQKHVDTRVQRVQTPKKPNTPAVTPGGKKTPGAAASAPASAAKKAATPAAAAADGKKVSCPACNKNFASADAMQQHTKAKHAAQ